MPQLVKRRRSGWAVLAAGALVASLFAVGAGPVSAQQPNARAANPNNNPDFGAHWSACVGAAGTHDQGFPDVGEDHTHAAAINCIAYYRITRGKGDGSYAPDEHVSAFQMRKFVERAAELMGADGDAVLGGVMLSDTVTRLEMAKLMFGLVDDIDAGLRINPRNGDVEFRNAANAWVVVDDYFADARAQVPNAESQLIGATYELGITRGTNMDGTRVSTPDSTFEPFKPVTRAQMAAFIARTLDHSNLRPEGVSVQRNLEDNTQVSVREGPDDDFAPRANVSVDVFSALYPDEAIGDDGSCVLDFVKDETPSHTRCEIDIGDQLTDSDGNVEFELSTDRDPIEVACGTGDTYTFKSVGPAGATVFWAWIGQPGDKVGGDTELSKLETVDRPVGRAGPDYLRISGGLPTGDELAKMGETVTFTAQLYSDMETRDGATLKDDKPAVPDRTGNVYLLQIERYLLTRVHGTDSDWGDDADAAATTPRVKSGNASTGGNFAYFADAPGDWNYGTLSVNGIDGEAIGALPAALAATESTLALARFGAAYQTPVFPNADGKFTIDLQNMDLYAAADNTDVGVRFVLRRFTPSNDLLDENPISDIVEHADTNTVTVAAAVSPLPYAGDDVATGAVIFSDDPSDTHSVSGESEAYRIISGSRTPNTVTVKVVDQYGDPQRNVDITVNSDLDKASPTGDDSDQVLYPEWVDITVQKGENGDGDRGADDTYPATGDAQDGETDLRNPTTGVTSLTLAARNAANVSPAPANAQTVLAALRVTDVVGAVAEVPEDDEIGTRKTRRDGTYRISYRYTASNVAQTETITPSSARIVRLGVEPSAVNTVGTYKADGTTGTLAEATVTDAELGSTVKVYWAKAGNLGRSVSEVGDAAVGFVPLRVADTDRLTIVANEAVTGTAATSSDEPSAYRYFETDYFIIENIGGVSFETFQEALGLSDLPGGEGCRASRVQWENYTTFADPNRYGALPSQRIRTIWRIEIN